MTVRFEIAEPCLETSAFSPASDGNSCDKEGCQSPTVRSGSEGRARRPEARRSSGSATAVEALMNNEH